MCSPSLHRSALEAKQRVADSLLPTSKRVVGAAGELVPPNDEARRPQELSDGFIVLALDALEATVAACDDGKAPSE